MTHGRPSEPTAESAPGGTASSDPASARPPGPVGAGTFSLEGRPAPGLYLVAWLLSGTGLAVAFVGSLTQPPVAGLLALVGLVLIGIGLSAAAGYQLLARAARPPAAYRGPSPLIVFLILYVFANVFGIAVLGLGLGGIGTTGGFLLGGGLIFVGYVVTVWLFVVRTGALSWAEMGLPRGRGMAATLGDIGFGAAVMVPVMLGVVLIGGLLAQLLGARPPQVVPIPDAPAELFAVALAAAVALPIGEEVFFRGFSLTAWWRDLGPRVALLRSSLFFALVHISNVTASTFDEGVRQVVIQSAVILPLGVVMGWLYLQRSLWASIGAHVTYNGIVVVLLASLRDLVPPPA